MGSREQGGELVVLLSVFRLPGPLRNSRSPGLGSRRLRLFVDLDLHIDLIPLFRALLSRNTGLSEPVELVLSLTLGLLVEGRLLPALRGSLSHKRSYSQRPIHGSGGRRRERVGPALGLALDELALQLALAFAFVEAFVELPFGLELALTIALGLALALVEPLVLALSLTFIPHGRLHCFVQLDVLDGVQTAHPPLSDPELVRSAEEEFQIRSEHRLELLVPFGRNEWLPILLRLLRARLSQTPLDDAHRLASSIPAVSLNSFPLHEDLVLCERLC
mmetsp:Transcript_2949/g.8814  ORF Transcript_2949/g.8814 Transcript_2949/m.8814 type:complete len:276 (-) Transcript_2949:307-1134(-)